MTTGAVHGAGIYFGDQLMISATYSAAGCIDSSVYNKHCCIALCEVIDADKAFVSRPTSSKSSTKNGIFVVGKECYVTTRMLFVIRDVLPLMRTMAADVAKEGRSLGLF